MSDVLTRDLADTLRRQAPDLCTALDRAIQDGYRPEHIQEWVDGLAATHRPAPAAVAQIYAYLCEVDPDFRRAEERRAVEPWS